MWGRIFAISSDLHRKFNKSLEREQHTAIDWAEETTSFSYIAPCLNSITKAQFAHYFLLFKEQEKDKQKPTLSSSSSQQGLEYTE